MQRLIVVNLLASVQEFILIQSNLPMSPLPAPGIYDGCALTSFHVDRA
jgi:hypothetical protein